MRYVTATLAQAEERVFGVAGRRRSTRGTEPVLTICARGSFTGKSAPLGAEAPTGTVLTAIVSTNSGIMFGYAITDETRRDEPGDPT